MTISSSTATSAAYMERPTRASGGTPPSGPPPEEMQEDMAKAIESLKTSNPELAEKMQKISDRMTELQESGVSMEEAQETLKTEFGEPTEDEMNQVASAMGKPRPPKPPTTSQTQLSSEDVSSYLTAQTSNSKVAEYLSASSSAA